MPGVTLSAQFRRRHARISSLRSPWGGGRANRTTGPRTERTVRPWPEALASSRGRTAAGADQLLAAEAGRLVHRALYGNRPRLAEAARRPRAARVRPPALRAPPPPRLAADRADQPGRPRDERPADPLPRRARREGRPDLRDAQVPDAPPGRRSEEHTSELQSRLHLVCRLLLEKKKKEKSTSIYSKKKKKTNQ